MDQPYCSVLTSKTTNASAISRWLCTVTLNDHPEGSPGEHVASFFSEDQGLSWTGPALVYPKLTAAGIVNSYSANLDTVTERVYVVANANLNNVSELPSGQHITRTDMLGYFVFRYTDDGGTTWNPELYNISYRQTSLDRANTFHGATDIFWNVDQFKYRQNHSYAMFTKVGAYAVNPPEQGFVLHSSNARTEPDPNKIEWNFLPDGDKGPACPPGYNPNTTNAEEWHVIPLAQSPGFYAVFRTNTGLLFSTRTSDATGQDGWIIPTPAQFQQPPLAGDTTNISAMLKNPRGPITLKPTVNGLYLLLWFNNGAKGFQTAVEASVSSRNPYWLSAGQEVDGGIVFTQPEVVLYMKGHHASDPLRVGYPDFIHDVDGSVWITETNKSTARVHRVQDSLLRQLYGQFTVATVASNGLIVDVTTPANGTVLPLPATIWPAPGNTSAYAGVTLDMWLEPASLNGGDTPLFISKGTAATLTLVQATNRSLTLTAADAHGVTSLTTDLACTKALAQPGPHHVGWTADVAVRLITVMVDGKLCDGSLVTPWGWAWLDDAQSQVGGGKTVDVGPGLQRLRVYNRALYVSELVGNYRAGV
eukprot:m.37424 g.37424  ORF g.37424 m.37424 type:complete len:590 (+) comp12499_c0_seq1:1-1770(+)